MWFDGDGGMGKVVKVVGIMKVMGSSRLLSSVSLSVIITMKNP